MNLYHRGIDLATNPKHTQWLSPVLLVADTVLCALIIWKIPCEQAFRASLYATIEALLGRILEIAADSR